MGKALSWGLSALAAYLAVLYILFYYPSAETPHSFLWLPAFSALTAANRRFFVEKDRRMARCAWWLGFLLALSFFVGVQAHRSFGGIGDVFCVFGAALCVSPSAAFLVGRACRFCEKAARSRVSASDSAANCSERLLFAGYTAILLLCWLPVFLAYYPGIFTYDVGKQIYETGRASYTTHHPLLHTFMLGGFYNLGGRMGSHNTGIALYTGVQMILIALTLAYALLYLRRLNCRRLIRVLVLLFFSFFPPCPLLAISATKDALYAPAFLMSALYLHQGYADPSRFRSVPFMLRLVLSLALICLLRNNAVFVAAFGLVFGVILIREKKARLRFAALMLAGMVLFGAVSLGLQKVVRVKPGPGRELLNIPIQQVSRVYKRHLEELDCAAEIEEILPKARYYTYYTADPVKGYAEIGMNNLGEFMRLWSKLLAQYPFEYIDAFLLANIGFWHLDDTSYAQVYGAGLDSRQGYLMTDTIPGYGVEHHSLLPALENLYERLFSANEYLSVPVVSALFSPAFFTWLLAFAAVYAIYAKQKAALLSCAFLFGNLLTLLLGPCALVRYAFPMMLSCPVLFGVAFRRT
ncbi:MAG: DUF6020 family protein [Clostridia bacterium]|nr:DUF6020 family protein [Clostridia bacterium]